MNNFKYQIGDAFLSLTTMDIMNDLEPQLKITIKSITDKGVLFSNNTYLCFRFFDMSIKLGLMIPTNGN